MCERCQELEREIALLKEQVRVGDVCSHYHMRRSFILAQANENANLAVQGLSDEIERLYAMILAQETKAP